VTAFASPPVYLRRIDEGKRQATKKELTRHHKVLKKATLLTLYHRAHGGDNTSPNEQLFGPSKVITKKVTCKRSHFPNILILHAKGYLREEQKPACTDEESRADDKPRYRLKARERKGGEKEQPKTNTKEREILTTKSILSARPKAPERPKKGGGGDKSKSQTDSTRELGGNAKLFQLIKSRKRDSPRKG